MRFRVILLYVKFSNDRRIGFEITLYAERKINVILDV